MTAQKNQYIERSIIPSNGLQELKDLNANQNNKMYEAEKIQEYKAENQEFTTKRERERKKSQNL